ncbi:hypothetical protein AVEN_81640-1 [Araneus ventricosus]|uniref:Uncharacterized protein n=1 Tax=Araneus ventricosus TaxID=182803 RepID=A0A4Y2H575_ARAVE|nr:hypothetical protein AVEN_81640-1 [Araneus ventricosus]
MNLMKKMTPHSGKHQRHLLGKGHAEFGQGCHQGPYGYTTQALSSVASNSGHDINKPVDTAQQGMYSNAGMPAPAQHHQSMGGPIASPQPMIQQGQQISRNPITMQTAAAYYPRNSVPPRAMQSMARNPLGAVVNQPGQQPSSQYGPMPTMVPLQPNFTSFPPTMVNPQFPQMYQQRTYNPPQYPIMAGQQYLWNYNTPSPQNSNVAQGNLKNIDDLIDMKFDQYTWQQKVVAEDG